MNLIIEKEGIKWILKEAFFSENGLVYKEAVPLELQSLIEEKQEIEEELTKVPSDEELLDWAKENHPVMIEMRKLEKRFDEIDERIEELSKLSFEG